MVPSQTAKAEEPFAAINTTPLIDVLLVLLVMILLSVPVATHVVTIDLPPGHPIIDPPPIHHDKNKISITPDDVITFNGHPVDQAELAVLLKTSLTIVPEPELQFQPDPRARYDTAAKVLNVIKGSGVTAFGMVGNEQFVEFGKAQSAPPVGP